jgi:predicted RecB family nuclease
LDSVGLTARARSALERLGVHTVGELLDYEPSALTRAQGVPDATRKEILAQARALRAELAATIEPAQPEADGPAPFGIEAICADLLPGKRAKDHAPLAMLLGQAATEDNAFLGWLPQKEAAVAIGQTQPQVSSGSPGALLRRSPLRTGHARFRATGSSKP